MMLRAAGLVPPTVLPGESLISTPILLLPRSRVPVASVPIRLP
jgi:hypothetical protein